MNRTLSNLQFPNLPTGHALRPYDLTLRESLRKQDTAVIGQINSQVQGVGATLNSSPTITLANAIHHVAGTAVIKNIKAPSGFTGPVFLIPNAVWTTITGGNIGLASTAVVGRALVMVFDGALWWPSY